MVINGKCVFFVLTKGVYPQSDGGLAIVHIDASKGFNDLWVHLTFAILLISI